MGSKNSGRPRVLCISPAHPPSDPRILKTIGTLANACDVMCLLPWRVDSSVGVLPFQRRLALRLCLVHPLIVWHLIRQRPRIIHVFMPELLPIALLFRIAGGRVVYEVQENHRLKFDRKPINNHWLFRQLFNWFDRLARRFCYCVFTDDSYLREYTHLRHPHAIVHNFPDVNAWSSANSDAQINISSEGAIELCYLGLITLDRGFDTMVAVVNQLRLIYPSIRLHLFGRCLVSQAELSKLPDYDAVRPHLCFQGHVAQAVALPVLKRCLAGLALLKPVGDYPDSFPTKLFEYMALGLPVITSNYPLYRAVIERAGCGFCMNPTDVDTITAQVRFLIEQPQLATSMEQRGKQFVDKYYSWQTEAKKLLELYQKIDFK